MSGKNAFELARLVSGSVVGDGSIAVVDVTHDSEMAGPGVLYVAVPGLVHDGHDYVKDVVKAGSRVVCVDRVMNLSVTQIVVEDPRSVMGPMAAAVHGDPSRTVPVIGVTGTNGKTTVTHFIESIAESAGLKVGLIGTIRSSVGGLHVGPSVRTTPEATDFQRLLAQMRDLDAQVISTEVSSHALELQRVNGTRFAVAAFTNLSQDHLDFHRDMASYRTAKERLFREHDIGRAVINTDDPVGRGIASWADMPVTAVGSGGDFYATNLILGSSGSSFDLHAPGRVVAIESPVIGEFNVKNLIMAAACCAALGIDVQRVLDGMCSVAGVPGRYELVSGSSPLQVVVDYAHTPVGIGLAIETGRQLARGSVIAVLGAGGDRDANKRPLMGAAAAAADLVIVTSDNPRSEDPAAIAGALASGIPSKTKRVIELDRRRAIEIALSRAEPGDLVLVLGKGHETVQEIAGVAEPFSDRKVVLDLLGKLDESAGPDPASGSMTA